MQPAATPSISYEASTFRGRRLAGCLLASLALHGAIIARLPQPRPLDAPLPPSVQARLMPAPSESPRLQSAARPQAHRPPAGARSPLRPLRPAPHGEYQRTPGAYVFEAYGEFGDELQQERLTQAQVAVPRGNKLALGPRPITPIQPRYPKRLLDEGTRGQVLLEAFISAGGAVQEVIVVNDGDQPEFAAAAVEAVRGTPFEPARSPQGATRSRITLRIQFQFE